MATKEVHQGIRPIANVEQVKAVAPRQAPFVRQQPGQKLCAILGHARQVGNSQFIPDRKRRAMQRCVDAMMIFAENFQGEPAFKLRNVMVARSSAG